MAQSKSINVCIVGTGYVGLVTGACLASIGHNIWFVDSDREKIDALLAGNVPIYEPGLDSLVAEGRKNKLLNFTTSIPEGVNEAEVVFICVGTPPRATGEADLVYVEQASKEIARNLNGYKVIAEKSTVPVQTGKRIELTLTRNNDGNHPFDVASNPEFLREGSAIADTMNPDRIVVGTNSPRAADILRNLYQPILERSKAPYIVTDMQTAELIKHASNAFLATKISFINVVANICERTGADVRKVAESMGYDKRIGRAFLDAGIGYGGSCFPKDVEAFIHIAGQLGYNFELLKAVAKINQQQRQNLVDKVRDALWNLEGKQIAVWGLAFKPNTDDIRNAPALDIVASLLKEGAHVKVYDPAAMEKAAEVLKDTHFSSSALDAAQDCDCLVVLTEWDEFSLVDKQKLKELLKYPIVIDGRNMFDRKEMEKLGFTYYGVGA